jgi:hypothetical protein
MGESVGHDIALAAPLQPIVADCRRRLQGRLDIAGLEQAPLLLRVVRPHPGQAIGLQFDANDVKLGAEQPGILRWMIAGCLISRIATALGPSTPRRRPGSPARCLSLPLHQWRHEWWPLARDAFAVYVELEPMVAAGEIVARNLAKRDAASADLIVAARLCCGTIRGSGRNFVNRIGATSATEQHPTCNTGFAADQELDSSASSVPPDLAPLD